MSSLDIDRLSVTYGHRTAVSEVSLSVAHGSTVGLVGESGSGKSSVANAVVGLAPVAGGDVRLDGSSVLGRSRAVVGARRRIQMIFQDPFSSLDPRMPIGASIAEAMISLKGRTGSGRPGREARRQRVRQLLGDVRIDPDRADELPAAFSGGQRQRITIARALAAEPDVLIADEVTSALDVSVQSTVLNLLRELQDRLGLSMLFISHDLAVVRYISDEIHVMRAGSIVESGATESLLSRPEDPYTRSLLDAVPVMGEEMTFDEVGS